MVWFFPTSFYCFWDLEKSAEPSSPQQCCSPRASVRIDTWQTLRTAPHVVLALWSSSFRNGCFLLCIHMADRWRGPSGLSYQCPDPNHEGPTLMTWSHPEGPHLQIPSYWGLGFQPVTFGGDSNIQSITPISCHKWWIFLKTKIPFLPLSNNIKSKHSRLHCSWGVYTYQHQKPSQKEEMKGQRLFCIYLNIKFQD